VFEVERDGFELELQLSNLDDRRLNEAASAALDFLTFVTTN